MNSDWVQCLGTSLLPCVQLMRTAIIHFWSNTNKEDLLGTLGNTEFSRGLVMAHTFGMPKHIGENEKHSFNDGFSP